jgi:drug/metabolite transporter (DMT)-like permease
MMVAAFGSAAMNALIRMVGSEVHPFEVAFFRNVFGLLVLVPVVARAGLASLATRVPHLHAIRGVLNAIAMLLWFYGVTLTPLATVAALSFLAPLFATVLAALVLGERVGPQRIAAVLVGFAGALLILRPGLQAPQLGEILVTLSSLAWAGALIDIKVLARSEPSVRITVYAALFLIPITLAFALPFWVWPNAHALAILFLIGAIGSLGQVAVAQAFREAEATQVLPADFTKLVWAGLLGWILFAERPDLVALAGGTIIFGSVLYVAWREARLQRRAGREPR